MSIPEEPSRSPRRSLTKAQRQTAVGIELIELCQTVTADGHLLDEEIGAIRQWLTDNRDTDLPAIDFLSQKVEQILLDGTVTHQERDDLYRAIETVLPPDIRESVR